MESIVNMDQKRKLYTSIIFYLDEANDDENFKEILKNFADIKIDKNEFINLFIIIAKIFAFHHRTTNFIQKTEQILLLMKTKYDTIEEISQNEIFDNFFPDRLFLILLFKTKILNVNNSLLTCIINNRDLNGMPYSFYLFAEIKPFIQDIDKKQILSEFSDLVKDLSLEFENEDSTEENLQQFKEKCLNGENDSHLCSLIRQDSVIEFIQYITKNNIHVNSSVKYSIFETNLFLIQNQPTTLIEYAAFYGSIEIFQYLYFNNAKISESLWLYAIHSDNAEIIHLFEQYHIEPKDETYIECFKESLKCHNNNVANYIYDNLVIYKNNKENLLLYGFQNDNYEFLPKGFEIIRSETDCVKLIIPPSITKIEKIVFFDSNRLKKITEVVIPSSIVSIKFGAFMGCSFLANIKIPSSVKKIGSRAFSGCSSIVNIELPSSVEVIKTYAFIDCWSLKKIVIPSSVISIGDGAFYNCKSLEEATVPPSVRFFGRDVFEGCNSLRRTFFFK